MSFTKQKVEIFADILDYDKPLITNKYYNTTNENEKILENKKILKKVKKFKV